jgi:hypothetical protein
MEWRTTIIALALFGILGCQSDIAVVDRTETRVVVDSFVQADQLGELDVLI